MGSSKKNQQADEPDVAGVDENDVSSNQEAVVIPYLAGLARSKVIWISPIYDKIKIEDTSGSGGKK